MNDEDFILRNHAALNIRRYDFLLDIYRLEKLKKLAVPNIVKGYAIFLTNNPSYWNKPKRKNTNGTCFRIHQGRRIKKGETLDWTDNTAQRITASRKALKLEKEYLFEWKLYSEIDSNKFQYLLVEV